MVLQCYCLFLWSSWQSAHSGHRMICCASLSVCVRERINASNENPMRQKCVYVRQLPRSITCKVQLYYIIFVLLCVFCCFRFISIFFFTLFIHCIIENVNRSLYSVRQSRANVNVQKKLIYTFHAFSLSFRSLSHQLP